MNSSITIKWARSTYNKVNKIVPNVMCNFKMLWINKAFTNYQNQACHHVSRITLLNELIIFTKHYYMLNLFTCKLLSRRKKCSFCKNMTAFISLNIHLWGETTSHKKARQSVCMMMSSLHGRRENKGIYRLFAVWFIVS